MKSLKYLQCLEGRILLRNDGHTTHPFIPKSVHVPKSFPNTWKWYAFVQRRADVELKVIFLVPHGRRTTASEMGLNHLRYTDVFHCRKKREFSLAKCHLKVSKHGKLIHFFFLSFLILGWRGPTTQCPLHCEINSASILRKDNGSSFRNSEDKITFPKLTFSAK